MKRINAIAVHRAAIGTIGIIVAMTLGTEFSPAFKSLLTSLSGHHWTAKSMIAVITFLVLYYVFKKSKESNSVFLHAVALCAAAIGGGLVIFGFYVWHFLNG